MNIGCDEMISEDVMKKIKKIEVVSNKLVEEVFSGEYKTSFKGKGLEFDSIRQYYFGDEIKSIDWNVTARHNKPYVKQFIEEREMNMFLIVDMSKSNTFARKREIVAEICATLAFCATKNGDNVGIILFTDTVEKFIPSKNSKKHILSIIDTILNFSPKNKGTNIKKALEFYESVTKKNSIIFLISDFFDTGYETKIKHLSKNNDLILMRVIDPVEKELPKGAIFYFEDIENDEVLVVDNIHNDVHLNHDINVPNKNLIMINTNENYIVPLRIFFKRRCQK